MTKVWNWLSPNRTTEQAMKNYFRNEYRNSYDAQAAYLAWKQGQEALQGQH